MLDDVKEIISKAIETYADENTTLENKTLAIADIAHIVQQKEQELIAQKNADELEKEGLRKRNQELLEANARFLEGYIIPNINDEPNKINKEKEEEQAKQELTNVFGEYTEEIVELMDND